MIEVSARYHRPMHTSCGARKSWPKEVTSNVSHAMDSEGCVYHMRHARDVKSTLCALFIKLHKCISLALSESVNANYKENVDYVLLLLLFISTLNLRLEIKLRLTCQ